MSHPIDVDHIERELVRKFIILLKAPETQDKAGLLHHIFCHTPLSTAAKRRVLIGLTESKKASSTSSSPAATPKEAPEFHLFSSLPKELRLHIWRLALPAPRLIELEIVDHTSIPASDAIESSSSPTSPTATHKSTNGSSDSTEVETLSDDGNEDYIDSDDDDDSDWQDLHDWHPNLRTRYTPASTPSLLHICSESRTEALSHYTPLSTGGYIDYTRDAIYLSRRCIVREPSGPFWAMDYPSPFALLDCTLSSAELTQLRFFALERDIWDMDDGAAAALMRDLKLVMIVKEERRRNRPEKGQWEIVIPPPIMEAMRPRDLTMEDLPEHVLCVGLMRLGPFERRPVFEFDGYREFALGSDERLTKDVPRRWERY